MADRIFDMWSDRKSRRVDQERIWKEVDRQIAMRPNIDHKMLPNQPEGADPFDDKARNGIDPKKAWMPEGELPLQAQALEVLVADARRMMFPDTGSWYRARSVVTDTYLDRVDFASLVAGDENDVPSQITQENVDKLVEGFGQHWRDHYNFRGHIDCLNGEAFKYGAFSGRGRNVKKRVIADNGEEMDKTIPMLIPKSVWNVYQDDEAVKFAGEGFDYGGGTIEVIPQKLEDLKRAANRGSNEPTSPLGGWMPKSLEGMETDNTGIVDVVEYEGDIIISRKATKSIFLKDVIITVAASRNKGGNRNVIRLRTRQPKSYIHHSYLQEKHDCPYGASPLMKGAPIQRAATHTLMQFLAWAQLDVQPPVAYSWDEPGYAATGGPIIFPGAQWRVTDPRAVNAVEIGDGTALQSAYVAFLNQYADVTGVNAPRLGAQTVSHTTAFAKGAELQRGESRTVQYVRAALQGPFQQWLQMEYTLGKKAMSGDETFFIRDYGGAVTIRKEHLPENVVFDVFGSSGPQEKLQETQNQIQAIQLVAQMEGMKVQLPPNSELDLMAAQREILGKVFSDPDIFFKQDPTGQGPGVAFDAGLQGAFEGAPTPEDGLLLAANG